MLPLRFTFLDGVFAVCKVRNLPNVNFDSSSFVSLTVTEEEISLVCPETEIPEGCLAAERGWRCLKILGPLDFSLTGVLSEVSAVLARKKISIFAVSTFRTDYILVKRERAADAAAALTEHGCVVIN